jgi:hypothetical protein
VVAVVVMVQTHHLQVVAVEQVDFDQQSLQQVVAEHLNHQFLLQLTLHTQSQLVLVALVQLHQQFKVVKVAPQPFQQSHLQVVLLVVKI